MDCKVIYEFDLSLSKTVLCFGFLCLDREVESEEIVWFGFWAGRDDMT